MTQKSLLIVDGNSWMHRAYHAIDAPLVAPDGRPTNALFGFFSMFGNIVSKLNPDGVIVAFDEGKPAFRYEVLKEYKMTRRPTDERLKAQFPTVCELLATLRVPVVKIPEWEGDDILGTLSLQAREKGIRSYLATSDKDAYQLLDDLTSVVGTKAGQRSEIVVVTPSDVIERYGIRTDQVIDFLGLKGDPSDNIPGILGIGEKTAAKLLQEYETMDAIIEAAKAGDITGHIGRKILDGERAAFASRKVATIVRDVPLDFDVETVEFGAFDRDEVVSAFTALRVRAPLTKLLTLQRGGAGQSEDSTAGAVLGGGFANGSAGNGLTDDRSAEDGSTASNLVEDKTAEYGSAGERPSGGAWAEVAADDPAPDCPPSPPANIEELLEDLDFNTEIAAYLLNSAQGHYDFETLAQRYLNIEIPEQTSLLEPAVDIELIKEKLIPILVAKLYAADMWDLYTQVELPLAAILTKMEKTGITLDIELLDNLARKGRETIGGLTGEIYGYAGREFLIDSPKQLSVVLFEELGLPPSKKTTTGYSTAVSVLEGLVDAHPIIEKIMLYREHVKLQSTYLEALPRLIGEDGKLHTNFNQTATATGRLSSSNPNLQNIPVRTDLGRRVREAFIPSHEGWKILSSDYSQIELRVLAHLSEDEGLIEAFEGGEDFHTATAARLFEVESEGVTPEHRLRAKAVNFGIVYGQTRHGLAQSLGIENHEAQEIIDRYYATYPRVSDYLQELVEQAQAQGWVATAFKRRRYIPEIHSSAYNVREFGKRIAMNHPMQGTAADLVKLAMLAVDKKLVEQDLQSRMLLQVHDELIFEGPEDEMEKLSALVVDAMSNVADLKVSLEVSVSIGDNWAQAK